MKITIETYPNTNAREVAEGLAGRAKLTLEIDGQVTVSDGAYCCEKCGLKMVVSNINRAVFAQELGQIREAMGGVMPKPAPEPGEEWKEGK